MSEAAGHLDDDAVVELIEGRADDAARARIEAHAADCAACRELLSALAQQAVTVGGANAAAPAGEVTAGAHVGRYLVLRLLGAGGMGIVFAARDPELDRTVAVKLLRASIDSEEAQLAMQERLRREAQAMARLSHPNVVAVYDVGTLGDRVFVAMEYVEGVTLTSWLATKRSLADILAVFDAAGRGLAAAHGQGLVHRDFKPENVLVGDDGRVRVTDFGVAKLGASPRTSVQRPLELTATNAALGTPFYMAPEQYLGEPVDPRTDQFSFCVALYAAVHGVRPFAGTTLDELAASAIAGKLTPPPVATAVPERIRAALVRGLSATPAERFPTMEALLAELQPPPPRRRTGYAIAAAAVVVAGLGAGVVALTRHAAPIAPPPPGSHDYTLPAIVKLPRADSPDLAPVVHETAAPDQLASMVMTSTWCEPRGVALAITAYGRIVAIGRDGAVTTVATIAPTMKALGSAVACLPSGRIVGVIRGSPFAIDGTAVVPVGAPPIDVRDAVVVGATIRWATPHGIWEWNGEGAAKLVRASCDHPLRLGPDGNRVACVRDDRIVVDAGSSTTEGPVGTTATWSHDGRALYVTSSGVVRRWRIGSDRIGEILATGVGPREVGPWLVVKDGSELDLVWIGPGAPHKHAPIDLGFGGSLASLVTPLATDAVVVAYGSALVRVVPLNEPPAELPRDRHLSSILALAFTPDGKALVSAGSDRRLIVHAADGLHLAGELAAPAVADSLIIPRADRSIVYADPNGAGRYTNGAFTAWPFGAYTGPVLASDDAIRFQLDAGVWTVTPDGARVATVIPGPLPRGLDLVQLSPARDTALFRTGPDFAELVDVATGKPRFTITVRGHGIHYVGLAGSDTIALSDASGQVFAIDASGVTSIAKLFEPITALAASPVAHRFAVGAGREVVIYDLAKHGEIAHHKLGATITALAWSRDGTRLAAATASTELAIWQP